MAQPYLAWLLSGHLMSFFHQKATCREPEVHPIVRPPIWHHIQFPPLEGRTLGNLPSFSVMKRPSSQHCIQCHPQEGLD